MIVCVDLKMVSYVEGKRVYRNPCGLEALNSATTSARLVIRIVFAICALAGIEVKFWKTIRLDMGLVYFKSVTMRYIFANCRYTYTSIIAA